MNFRFAFLLFFLPYCALAQEPLGSVQGRLLLLDSMTAFGAKVELFDSNGLQARTTTNYEGVFRINGIPAGEYSLRCIFHGDTLERSIDIEQDRIHFCGDLVFTSRLLLIDCFPPRIPKIERKLIQRYFHDKLTIKKEEIQQSALRFELLRLIESRSEDVQLIENTSQPIILGSRQGDYQTFIDGVKVRGNQNLPSVGLREITVYTGGIPAKFGDTTGGVVVLETSSYFDLLHEWKMNN